MNYAAAARCNVPCKCGVPECGVEFAFEIGSGLLAEVRRLQGLLVERDAFIAQQDSIIAGRDTIIADQDGLLAERDKIIQDMKEEKADLKKSVESLRAALAKQTAALRTQLPVVSPAESVPSVTDPLASQIASLRIADTAKSEVDRANSVAGEIKVTPETAEFKHTPALRQRLRALRPRFFSPQPQSVSSLNPNPLIESRSLSASQAPFFVLSLVPLLATTRRLSKGQHEMTPTPCGLNDRRDSTATLDSVHIDRFTRVTA